MRASRIESSSGEREDTYVAEIPRCTAKKKCPAQKGDLKQAEVTHRANEGRELVGHSDAQWKKLAEQHSCMPAKYRGWRVLHAPLGGGSRTSNTC